MIPEGEAGEVLETVLLETARPIDAAAIGGVLGPLVGLAAADAVRQARYSAGVLLEGVPAEVAAAAVAGLALEGIGARRIPAAGLPVIARPHRAVRAIAEEAGLTLGLGLGREARIAWDEPVLVLACGLDAGPAGERVGGPGAARAKPDRVTARFSERDPAVLLAGEEAGLSPATVRLIAGLARRRRQERRETALALDLVLPDGRAFRLRRADLDLVRAPGLEGAAPHSVEAFVVLARAVSAAAIRAIRPPENATLLEVGLLEPALFTHGEEVLRYERWLLAPRASGGDAAAAEGGA